MEDEKIEEIVSRFAFNCILIVLAVYIKQKEYSEVVVEQDNLKKQ
jgi:hypothetical protein